MISCGALWRQSGILTKQTSTLIYGRNKENVEFYINSYQADLNFIYFFSDLNTVLFVETGILGF